MVLVTSVFFVQLLCALVPCNPNYPVPDLSQDPRHSDTNHIRSTLESHFFKRLWPWSTESHPSPPHPLIPTEGGLVQGYKIRVVGSREVHAWQGIPYGEPPTGHLRFKSPLPKAPWSGVLHALSPGPPCLQYNVPKGFRVLGQEDCLSLDIYSPQIPSEGSHPKLPVIVFLHGGGFFFGSSGFYGPSYMLQKDVVLCIPQYRLGVLGFLSSGDSVSPGNWALKDQLLALRWISNNIAAFGGDPLRVTIMGQSAGSALVHFHLLSPSSRPYFHGAVSMSGVAFNYWALHSPQEARNYSQTLSGLVGCPDQDSKEMIECLRNINPVLLVTQTQFFLDDWPYPSNAWRPCVETVEGNPDPFLTDYPLALYSRGDVAKVPWIVTLVSGEGYQFLLFPFITLQMKTLRKNWARLASDLADVDRFGSVLNLDEITKKITQFYFQNVPPIVAPVHNFANIITDRMFLSGIYKAAQAHSRLAPTYSYIFDVNGQYNIIENFGYPRSEWGVGHAEDLFYVFNSSITYHGFKREDPEFEVSQFLVNVFTNFAAKGELLFTRDDGTESLVWEPHTSPRNLNFLKITPDMASMVGDPFRKRVRFWDRMHIPDTPSEEEILNSRETIGQSSQITNNYKASFP